MAYELLPDGRVIATTLEDAIAWQNAKSAVGAVLNVASQTQGQPQAAATQKGVPTGTDERSLWLSGAAGLDERDRSVIQKVVDAESIRRVALKKVLTEHGTSLLRFLERIEATATESGFQREDILERTESGAGPKKVVTFRPGRLLRAYGLGAADLSKTK